MNSRQQAKQHTEEKILHTALQLFGREGFNSTSMRTIAREAGISLGLTYNYFKSKEDLLKAIMQRSMQDIQTSMQVLPDSGSLTLALLTSNMLSVVKQNRDFWRLHHSLRMQQSIMDNLQEESRQMQDYILRQLQSLPEIKSLDNPQAEAQLLFSTLDGIIYHYLFDPSYPAKEMMTLVVKKYTKI